MSTVEARGRRAQDIATARALDLLTQRGVLAAGDPFDADGFHDLRGRVGAAFEVPQTAITPIMARLLFAVAQRVTPSRLLVAGSYAGNALVWLAGAAPQGSEAIGVDTDPRAVRIARDNVERLGLEGVRCLCADAFAADSWLSGTLDLVLVDIDEPERRKAGYAKLLEQLEPFLADSAVVLAHDVCYPDFASDVRPYLANVRDPRRFSATLTLRVDPFGIEVTRKRPPAPSAEDSQT